MRLLPSSLLLALVACGGGKGSATIGPVGSDGTTTTPPVEYTIEQAELAFTDPGPAGFTGHGSAVALGGVAKAMQQVTVAGVPATLDGAGFTADLDLLPGIHVIEVEATDVEGGAHSDRGAILAGDFAAPDGPNYDAIQMHMSEASIRALGTVLEGFITPDVLDPTIQGLNPVVDSPDAIVTLGNLTFDTAEVDLSPTAQGLRLEMLLPGFVLPIHATVPDVFLGIDVNVSADLRADLWISALVDVTTDGRGHLVVNVSDVEADLGDFDLDTGLLELIDWIFIDDADLAAYLETQFTAFGPALANGINGMLGGLDLTTEMDLMGTMVRLQPAFDRAIVDTDGMYLSMAFDVSVDEVLTHAPGHLHFDAPAPQLGQKLHAQISDDFLNRTLHEVWAGGMLDLEMPIGDGPEATLLLLFGGRDEGALVLDARLPPVFVDRNGEGRLQMGELYLTIETPGGSYGEKVELLLTLDARADLAFDGDTASVALSDAQVDLVAVGDSADNPDLDTETLSAAFGAAVGIINGLLSFPLDGMVKPGTLPSAEFSRDPSGRGTAVDLDLGQIDLEGLLGFVPTPPNDVPVDAAAKVYSVDIEVSDVSAMGWVCPTTTVTASGNWGTWWVEGGVIASGNGHVLYAVDGSHVVLETPGHTVFADPGASVDDRDGTNTVTFLDPLELDLSTAPSPGCP